MSMMNPPGRASHASALAPVGSIPPSLSPYPGTSVNFANASYGSAPPINTNVQSALSIAPSRMEPPPLSSTQGPMPGTAARPLAGPKKRLIITCDGTWLDADNGLMNGRVQPPSNVSRMGWAIKETSRDGIPQVVNYQAGVGTAGGRLSRIAGGATGYGLKGNVRDAYIYIATNWRQGDEIFLMGFSRGAFTARSVGGMIADLGLLTRRGLPHFSEIFEDYEHKNDERYTSSLPDSPFRDKGPFDDNYVAELERLGMTKRNVPIKAICCWDTVGALGIPRTPWLNMMRRDKTLKEYQFDDTRISPCVENAFQALALDEMRAPFSPALWEKQDNSGPTNLKQVWFPGVHSNIGGGYDDQEIANITLAWMMSRLEPFLDFRPDFLVSQLDAQRDYYKDSGQKPRWWSFGEIYNSLKGAYSLTGRKARTPGGYQRMDPYNGRPTGKRLKNTNEYIHASVRARIGLRGPGPMDRGDYNPQALADWTFEPEPTPIGGAAQGQGGNLSDGMMVVWNYRSDRDHGGLQQTRIPEAVLLETELALLRQFQAVDDYIHFMRPPSGKRRSKKYHGDKMNGNAEVPPVAAGGMGMGGRPMSRGDKRRSMGPVPDDFAVPMDEEIDGDERGHRKHRRRTRGNSVGPDDYRDPAKEERRRRRTSARY